MKIAINPTRLNFLISKTTCCFFNFKPHPSSLSLHLPTNRGSTTRKPPPFFFHSRAMALSPCSFSSSVHVVKEKIDLTDKEQLIFQLLLQVVRHFDLQTQLRVAGGWVRDKLLGKDCYDIDIALDNMLGKQFCEKVNEYFSFTGEETQGVAVIQSNPDQSKHLETARMRIYDTWIDFVNLRSEDYSENSRIPTMRFGTAKQDAFRRDLTINSLFYNINASSVEDFTERGLADLKNGRIVTPLPAKDTFLDDPLRVLRAIRFGSQQHQPIEYQETINNNASESEIETLYQGARFGFVLDEKLKEAATCDDVRAAIADKISRERIGHEIDLMISGAHPVKAMTYICDLQLFWVVFCLPLKFEPATNEKCDRLCIACMDAMWDLIQLCECSSFSDEERRLSSYAALFLPFRKTIYKDKKAKKIPVVDYIFRNSLKLKVNDAQSVINVHHGSEKFVSLIPYIVADEDIQVAEIYWKREIIDVPSVLKLRIFVGLLLDEIKGLWRVALLASTLLHPTSIDCTDAFSNKHFELNKRRKLFMKVEDVILRLGLDKIWEVKPLVNGKDIMSVLQLGSGGPLVSEWQQKLRQWQLANPSGTKDDCLDWMKQTHSKRVKME